MNKHIIVVILKKLKEYCSIFFSIYQKLVQNISEYEYEHTRV